MLEQKAWDHTIDLKTDFIPKDCKIYPLSPEKQKEQDKFLEENLRKGYIWPSKSPMASPFFFVSKKDLKKLRPCQDYRRLNEGTIKNAYPLPWVDELLDKLKGAKYFTKLNLQWEYNNVRIKEGDEWKVAFKMNKGLFEPLVMFFGLCNSLATFQNMMNDIFVMETNEGWILIYIDDILIFSKRKEELQKLTLRVLKKLQENDLFANLDKCTFEATEVDYLGMIISEDQIKMDPAKLEGIKDWPSPTTVKQVRSFLGFGNFYRKFIGHYANPWMIWRRKIWHGIGQTLAKKHLRSWKKNSRKHQCFWCPTRRNHSSSKPMPPNLPLEQSYDKKTWMATTTPVDISHTHLMRHNRTTRFTTEN